MCVSSLLSLITAGASIIPNKLEWWLKHTFIRFLCGLIMNLIGNCVFDWFLVIYLLAWKEQDLNLKQKEKTIIKSVKKKIHIYLVLSNKNK